MVGFVPIADKNSVVAVGFGERDGDSGAAEDADGAKSTGGFVESERWEIVEAADLIFHLHSIGKVLARRDRTCCPIYSVFERVLPLLDPTPEVIVGNRKYVNMMNSHSFDLSIGVQL